MQKFTEKECLVFGHMDVQLICVECEELFTSHQFQNSKGEIRIAHDYCIM